MTTKEQIERITKLLNELNLDDITSAEFDEMFPKQSINDLKDELWRMYCFAEDVCVTINMGDTAEQAPSYSPKPVITIDGIRYIAEEPRLKTVHKDGEVVIGGFKEIV